METSDCRPRGRLTECRPGSARPHGGSNRWIPLNEPTKAARAREPTRAWFVTDAPRRPRGGPGGSDPDCRVPDPCELSQPCRGPARLSALLGREKSPLERGIFHRLSLVAFSRGRLARRMFRRATDPRGLSRLHGETYWRSAGGRHRHHGLRIAPATARSSSCSPAAAAATRANRSSIRLSESSAVALVVDYVLTIAVSVASGVDALLSFASHTDTPYKVWICLAAIIGLVTINLRGVKESVKILLPIFLLFLVTHVILIGTALGTHAHGIPVVVSDSWQQTARASDGPACGRPFSCSCVPTAWGRHLHRHRGGLEWRAVLGSRGFARQEDDAVHGAVACDHRRRHPGRLRLFDLEHQPGEL